MKVNERLTLHGHLDARQIHVQVDNGVLTLTGNVPFKPAFACVVQMVIPFSVLKPRLRAAQSNECVQDPFASLKRVDNDAGKGFPK